MKKWNKPQILDLSIKKTEENSKYPCHWGGGSPGNNRCSKANAFGNKGCGGSFYIDDPSNQGKNGLCIFGPASGDIGPEGLPDMTVS